jgi:hypothetical protein
MRFLIKLIILAAVCYVLYYFFGRQIDDFFAGAKTTVQNIMKGQHIEQPAHRAPEEPKYYPIQKRTE